MTSDSVHVQSYGTNSTGTVQWAEFRFSQFIRWWLLGGGDISQLHQLLWATAGGYVPVVTTGGVRWYIIVLSEVVVIIR